MKAEEIISSGILETYVMGLATEAEAALVQAWAEEHPSVKAELEAIERSMERYAFDHAVKPAEHVKENIMEQLPAPAVQPTTAPVRALFPWKYIAAASIVLLAGSLYFSWFYYNKSNEADQALATTHAALEAANRKLDTMDNDMAVVKNKYSRTVSLDGMEAAPDATAKIFWMKNTGEVYVDGSNLPATPAGMQYQLWGIVDGKPVDGGMLVTSASGSQYHIQKMKTFGKAEAFAITLEKEGGNPEPEGKMYVMGKL
ncbi:MAG: anti-sigma factor [Ferruginibacter sp.]